jgi:ribosome-associated protein
LKASPRRAYPWHVRIAREKGDHPLTTAVRREGPRRAPRSASARRAPPAPDSHPLILASLDESKAEDIVSIDITGKSPLADHMVIATGRSPRHVAAIAERLSEDLRKGGVGGIRTEGLRAADWVLIDSGDVVIHVFRAEVRAFYNLEKMWRAEHPAAPTEV